MIESRRTQDASVRNRSLYQDVGNRRSMSALIRISCGYSRGKRPKSSAHWDGFAAAGPAVINIHEPIAQWVAAPYATRADKRVPFTFLARGHVVWGCGGEWGRGHDDVCIDASRHAVLELDQASNNPAQPNPCPLSEDAGWAVQRGPTNDKWIQRKWVHLRLR